MEFGSIEREIYVDASPEVVYEVVSTPEHVSQWWTDDASFQPAAGAVGEFVWGERTMVQAMTVVEAVPPRLFSFRWCYPEGDIESSNFLYVRFELTPSGTGTKIRMVETGFREMGWEEAKVGEMYHDHVEGWDMFIPRLGDYIARMVSAR